jgi:hypothetical protein
MTSKFEQLIEYVINDEEAKAKELFHDIVVEKSREIYENLMMTKKRLSWKKPNPPTTKTKKLKKLAKKLPKIIEYDDKKDRKERMDEGRRRRNGRVHEETIGRRRC